MKSQKGRIFGSGDRAGGNQDRRREGERNIGVADTQVCQRYTEVLRIGKLLSPIH